MNTVVVYWATPHQSQNIVFRVIQTAVHTHCK